MTLKQSTVRGNEAVSLGGGVYCEASPVWIGHVTFFGNSGSGAGCVLSVDASPTIEASILGFSVRGAGIACMGSGSPNLSYCDVYGNAGGDSLCGWNGGGNISEDPLFCDVWQNDFSVCENSPCIDPAAPSGLIGRLGAGCEDCGATGIEPAEEEVRRLRVSNAPNPFGATTTLVYELPAPCADASLSIYNLRGQRVRVLARGPAARGRHAAVWNGRDEAGTPVAAGVYFYVLTAAGERATGRTVLLR